MLTYQLQSRLYITKQDFTFPNEVEVEMWLHPAVPFGAAEGHARMVVTGSQKTLFFDRNGGRTSVINVPPLPVVEVILDHGNLTVSLLGNKLIAKGGL